MALTVCHFVCRLLQKSGRMSMIRNAIWCLSNLCRGKNPPPEFSKVLALFWIEIRMKTVIVMMMVIVMATYSKTVRISVIYEQLFVLHVVAVGLSLFVDGWSGMHFLSTSEVRCRALTVFIHWRKNVFIHWVLRWLYAIAMSIYLSVHFCVAWYTLAVFSSPWESSLPQLCEVYVSCGDLVVTSTALHYSTFTTI